MVVCIGHVTLPHSLLIWWFLSLPSCPFWKEGRKEGRERKVSREGRTDGIRERKRGGKADKEGERRGGGGDR